MPDFGAILRKARERAKNAGAGGAGGATNEKPLQFKDNREPHPGPTGPTKKHDFRKNADVEAFRRAALRNSLDLYEPQLDLTRCYICGGQEEQGRLFIAVLTAKPGAHHWMHSDCHPEHVRRLDARVEATLADDAF